MAVVRQAHHERMRGIRHLRGAPSVRYADGWDGSGAMMQYKGYRAAVAFDDSAGVFHGEVVDTRDVITFEGDSVERLRKEFEVSVDDYLAVCAERGCADPLTR